MYEYSCCDIETKAQSSHLLFEHTSFKLIKKSDDRLASILLFVSY